LASYEAKNYRNIEKGGKQQLVLLNFSCIKTFKRGRLKYLENLLKIQGGVSRFQGGLKISKTKVFNLERSSEGEEEQRESLLNHPCFTAI